MTRYNQSTKKPTNISASGWKKIALSVKDQIGENNVSIVSAGVAFYAFLAIFPAIMALISIYGLAVSPEQIQQQIEQLSSMMPQEAFSVLEDRIDNFISTPGEALGWGTAIGILFSLWSANKGTKSLFTGIEIAYGTPNDRNFFKENALTLSFTLGAIILVILCMAIIVGFPAFVDQLNLPSGLETTIGWARWIILAIIVVFYFALAYKYAPARKGPTMKWVYIGAIFATVLWLIASWGFSYYVSNFGNYGELYGSISAVVVLLMWLYLTSFIILIGAEVNSESEHFAKRGFTSKAAKGKK